LTQPAWLFFGCVVIVPIAKGLWCHKPVQKIQIRNTVNNLTQNSIWGAKRVAKDLKNVRKIGLEAKINSWVICVLNFGNRKAHIRQQCRETIVLSCHRYLINTSVKK
jgi:hypothetical protein